MRRVIIVLVLLAAIGAAVWFFMFRGAGGTPPALAAQLDKANTVAFGSIEQPDALFSRLLSSVDQTSLPADAPKVHDPAVRSAQLGFDPATAAGWQAIGIDSKAGLGVVVDSRLKGRPYVIAKIDDEAKFLKWLGERVGGEAKIADGALSAGTKKPLAHARRGGFTLLAEHVKPEELKVIAESKGEPLSKADSFKDAFAGAKPGGRVMGFVPVANLRSMPNTDGVVGESIGFYAQLFPAIGIYGNADDFRIRLATTEKGRSVLKQVFEPGKAAPKFSKWLPAEGFAVLRYSVNLKELFTGMQALLPPAIPEQIKMQLGMAPMALSFVGIDWNVVTEAFTGHVAFAIKPDGGMPGVVALFGLGNADKADNLIADIEKNASRLLKGFGGGGPALADVEVDGAKGKVATIGGQKVYLVRSGDMLIFASSEALLKETLARGKGGQPSLAGTPGGKVLDADAIFAATMNLPSMLPKHTPPELMALVKGLPPIEAAVRLDRHGIAFEGKTVTMLVGLGVSVFGYMRAVSAMEANIRAMEAEAVVREAAPKVIEPPAVATPSAPAAPGTAAPASGAP